MITCKEFLHALNEYLDGTEDEQIRRDVEEHIGECPNCWVIFDTTQKTLKVFKGMERQDLPEGVHNRLMDRLQQKIQQAGPPPGPLPGA